VTLVRRGATGAAWLKLVADYMPVRVGKPTDAVFTSSFCDNKVLFRGARLRKLLEIAGCSYHLGTSLTNNTKRTSPRIATLASATLQNDRASQIAKSLAASALAQANGARQTGAEMEDLASRVLRSDKYADDTKALAASVLAQSNVAR
jgi:hypothetical protein